ncbi:MAG: SHOCT domain-containing protein [Actinomycetota bacterium]|nr:SHOCT domain-containing protein [Actinomycetota bacterium]
MRSDNRRLLIVFVVLLMLALIGPIIGGTLFGTGGMWENTDRAPGWALGLVAAFIGPSMLATPTALIVGIILLVRWLGGSSTGRDREAQEKDRGMGDPALETLRQRYAAGEVSQEEYKHIRQTLEL